MSGYLHSAYHSMRARCTNPLNPNYKGYSGRGIRVFKPWLKNKYAFYGWIRRNIGERPSTKYSLDRINNDRGYMPGNLRWATWSEQQSNKRVPQGSSVLYKGVRMSQSQCAREIGVTRQCVSLYKNKPNNLYGIEFL